MNLGFKNKTVLVTGGSKGIGKAIAIAFAEEGTNVIICGRGEEALKDTAREIETLGGNVLAIQADVTNQTDVEHLISSAIDRYKTIDILVNNTGVASDSMTLKHWI